MIILAIDTSAGRLSAALCEDQAIRGEVTLGSGVNISQHLLPAVEDLCALTGLTSEKIDVFACTTGPGSFTGVRIGISTVKGLAIATGKPVVGISTLEAMAANIAVPRLPICPMMDARRGRVYAALYELREDGQPLAVRAECLTTPEAFLQELTDPVVFMGSGVSTYGDSIRRRFENPRCAPAHHWNVRASVVGLLGIQRLRKGEIFDPVALTPTYLQQSTAEEKLPGRG